MRRRGWLGRAGRLAAALALMAAAGCTYLGNRGRDAAEIVDLGVTVSARPQFGLYMGLCPLPLGFGAGRVDGWYAGVGGGKVGLLEYQQRGRGRQMWGPHTCPEAPETPEGGDSEDKPAPSGCFTFGCYGQGGFNPTCTHFLHLGWTGLTFNARPLEAVDFLLGWFGLDIMGDDVRVARRTKEAGEDSAQEQHRERIGEPHPLPRQEVPAPRTLHQGARPHVAGPPNSRQPHPKNHVLGQQDLAEGPLQRPCCPGPAGH